MGGRVVEAWKIELSWAGEQRCWEAPSPLHIPQPKSQREAVPVMELACTVQAPNAVLLWIIPPTGLPASLLVLQGPSCS